MRSDSSTQKSGSLRTATALSLLVLLSAGLGCESGDATSPVPPPDAAVDRASSGDAGGDAQVTDAQEQDSANGPDGGGDGAAAGDGASADGAPGDAAGE